MSAAFNGQASREVEPAQVWQLRSRQLRYQGMPLLMGIVNVTPDSFSDGGLYLDPQAAVDHAFRLVEDGADIIDIGGESTRPFAEPVSAAEELRRVMPVLERLSGKLPVPISIDTYKAQVAREAIQAGVEILNDVTALTGDPQMLSVVQESGVGVCIMHMKGRPSNMQINPTYDDVVEEVFEFLARQQQALIQAGVEKSRICVDPGIGFGKLLEHNLTLLRNMWRFHGLGSMILVGHSRKRFIGQIIGNMDVPRDSGTIAVALALAQQKVQVLRVHNVAAVKQALQVFQAVGGV